MYKMVQTNSEKTTCMILITTFAYSIYIFAVQFIEYNNGIRKAQRLNILIHTIDSFISKKNYLV